MHKGNKVKEYMKTWYWRNKLGISEVFQNAVVIVFRSKGSIFQSIISRCFWYFWETILNASSRSISLLTRKKLLWENTAVFKKYQRLKSEQMPHRKKGNFRTRNLMPFSRQVIYILCIEQNKLLKKYTTIYRIQ